MNEIKRVFIDMEGFAAGKNLPTFEELGSGFPHADGCSRKAPLNAISEIEMVSTGEPRVGSVGARSYFLRCDECHIQREYRK